MDLFTAARSLSRPFEFTAGDRDRELGIGARGLIGDGFSCALVRVDGAIDWLCLPRFDSPSVFGALLDPERGGLTAITPAQRPFDSLQRYDPDTNVLETLFRVHDRGQVRLTDYMPWSDDPRATIHEIHRRIECREGDVELELVFDPRFGYGLDQTRVEATEHGLLATGPGGERMVAAVGRPVEWKPRPGGGRIGRLRLRAGDRCWMVLSWDSPPARADRGLPAVRAPARHPPRLARMVASAELRRPLAPPRHARRAGAQAVDLRAQPGRWWRRRPRRCRNGSGACATGTTAIPGRATRR